MDLLKKADHNAKITETESIKLHWQQLKIKYLVLVI